MALCHLYTVHMPWPFGLTWMVRGLLSIWYMSICGRGSYFMIFFFHSTQREFYFSEETLSKFRWYRQIKWWKQIYAYAQCKYCYCYYLFAWTEVKNLSNVLYVYMNIVVVRQQSHNLLIHLSHVPRVYLSLHKIVPCQCHSTIIMMIFDCYYSYTYVIYI